MTSKSLVIDSSIETGPVNFTFLNNREEAKKHMYDARKFLASVKLKYGVYDRIAAGDPGGFFHESIDLPDGTRISVSTNDGVDTAIIAAPSRVVEEEKKEEDVVEDVIIGEDFFVGVKYISGGRKAPGPVVDDVIEPGLLSDRFVVPHLCLWVPEKAGDDTEDRLVVSNRNSILNVNPDDPDEFFVNSYITRPHFDNKDEFPLGLFRSKQWVVEEAVKIGGELWDVVIRYKGGRPPEGAYDVKVCVVGGDCQAVTPAEFEVEMRLGNKAASTRFVVSEFTAYVKLTMPKGFFWADSVLGRGLGNGSVAWYSIPRDGRGAMDGGFGNSSIHPADQGENPHGPNWWQGGIKAYLDYNPKVKENTTSIQVVSGDDEPFLIPGYFNPNTSANYAYPFDRSFDFATPYSAYPSIHDRCGYASGTSSSRYWVEMPLNLSGQNVVVSGSGNGVSKDPKCQAQNGGAPAPSSIVILNLGSSNENGLIVDIPGVPDGTKVTFHSPVSMRNIPATVQRIPGTTAGQGAPVKAANSSSPCYYGTFNVATRYNPANPDNKLVDWFYLSYVVTDADMPGPPPYYKREYVRTTSVDSTLQTEGIAPTENRQLVAFMELGAFAEAIKPMTYGWWNILETKIWPAERG